MRFNSKVVEHSSTSVKTQNYEGGEAFTLDPKAELYQRVATCLLAEPKYYDPWGQDTLESMSLLIDTISKQDPEWILKLAVYCRNEMHLRSVSVYLLGQSVLHKETRIHVRKYTPLIIKRADEMLEVLAYLKSQLGDFGNRSPKGMLPASIKKGLAYTIKKFDEYQLAKYNQKDKPFKMGDVIKLTHPKPNDKEQADLWKRAMENKLQVPQTWETYISANGSTKENWEFIAPKMPIMAQLRNLRNLLDKEVDDDIIWAIVRTLQNKDVILKSKQFPYRFYAAYKSIEDHKNSITKHLMAALEDALEISIANLPHLKGTTALFADVSGSMDEPVSHHSKIKRDEISCLLLAMADKICDRCITAVYADDVDRMNLNPRDSIITNTKKLLSSSERGGGTLTYKCIASLQEKVDRMIFFTDEQAYGGSLNSYWQNYKARRGSDTYLYTVDLVGYGTVSIPNNEPKVAMIAGWSERLLEYITIFESKGKIPIL